jgi:DNA-binding CsgD family transcriptional regulator
VAGRVVHETPALAALLAGAPGAAAVREAARAMAGAAALLLRRGTPGDALAALDAARRAVPAPGGGAYRLRCTVAPGGLAPGRDALVVHVDGPDAAPRAALGGGPTPVAPTTVAPTTVAPAGAAPAGDDAARARYGLTAQELAVARHMAARHTDPEIGRALGISPHTARTHAERVRRKLGVTRRAEVAAALAAAAVGAAARGRP